MAPKFLSQLKSLPHAQRVALGAGAAGTLGFGLYSYRKKKTGTTKPAASTTGGAQTALTPTPSDLSQYAVLVPINWQDGANFGGPGGLTHPLTPGVTPPATTPPPAPTPTPARPPVPRVPGPPVYAPPVYSFPTTQPLPTQPVSVYQSALGHDITLSPTGGSLGERVWAAALANPNLPLSMRQQAGNLYTTKAV